MIEVSVIGATGYTGEELVRILSSHPKVTLSALFAKIDEPKRIDILIPSLSGKVDVVCELPELSKILHTAEFFFLALPHSVSMKYVPVLLRHKKRMIDLSADYRLPYLQYKKYYKVAHTDKEGIKKAVYGLPEIYRDRIRGAQLVANPGCYPTSVLLGLLPLIKSDFIEGDEIIIDSKSGVTGAGRKADLMLSFGEVNESVRPYKVNSHQHMPEIELIINKNRINKRILKVIFVPHLMPLNRGMISAMYVRCRKGLSEDTIHSLFRKFYNSEPFVRVREIGAFPQIKDVVNTNFCHIGLRFDRRSGICIVISAIDNLKKGAAGQAVQNMNIMLNLNEKEGLI